MTEEPWKEVYRPQRTGGRGPPTKERRPPRRDEDQPARRGEPPTIGAIDSFLLVLVAVDAFPVVISPQLALLFSVRVLSSAFPIPDEGTTHMGRATIGEKKTTHKGRATNGRGKPPTREGEENGDIFPLG